MQSVYMDVLKKENNIILFKKMVDFSLFLMQAKWSC